MTEVDSGRKRGILRSIALGAALTVVGAPPATAQTPRLEIEVEVGPAWQTANDVEIPNDGTATRFSLSRLAGTGPSPTGRAYLSLGLSERHSLRLLYAPLSISGIGSPNGPIDFAGAAYAGGIPAEATYTFNSYRLSYRWLARSSERFSWWLGLTAKVRDATISLEQGSTTSRKDDLGFVPLLHLAGEWRPRSSWYLSLDADGLAGGPGRAVDAALRIGYDIGDRWSLRLGYRTLEGGADVEEVYAFAWLHYAVASVVWRW